MKVLLALWGHEARSAFSGAEALQVVMEFRPRVVLLDLGLPDKHGYDVAGEIRDAAKNREVFFVAVTGWNQVADQARSAAVGVTHHLMKPPNPHVLKEILAAYAAAEPSFAPEPALSEPSSEAAAP